jgi:hypothetical protein
MTSCTASCTAGSLPVQVYICTVVQSSLVLVIIPQNGVICYPFAHMLR